ncbi:MAG: ComF family protein, partial [Gammaproteobacteria bacterium]|nr:ComF family protein [Gammaproteobacteria bacterium]
RPKWFVPHCQCSLCADSVSLNQLLCGPCLEDMRRVQPGCAVCADALDGISGTEMVCGRCQQHRPSFDETYAAFVYQPPMTRLLWQFKFRARFDIGNFFCHQMVRDLVPKDRPDYLISVPMHTTAIKERGYNQSAYLANLLARELKRPVYHDVYERNTTKTPQHQLNLKHRKRNLQDAFILAKPRAGKHVAIVDDVITTGATMEVLAAPLKAFGVERISVWAVCRTYRE